MRLSLALCSEPVWSGRLPSWADFITTIEIDPRSGTARTGLLVGN
jgi:hypothetical protein